jgi:hypothetical protein
MNFKKMKIIKSTLTAVLILFFFHGFSQPDDRREDKKEQIESMKIGFLTKRLNLSPEEAKTFWPVYNQYQNELETLRSSRKKDFHDGKTDFAEMSDKDAEKLVDNEIAFRQSELDVMKKYHSQFKQVLPIKKVATLYRTEEDFKRELLQRIQERKKDMRERPER